jgi:hypothetical protein
MKWLAITFLQIVVNLLREGRRVVVDLLAAAIDGEANSRTQFGDRDMAIRRFWNSVVVKKRMMWECIEHHFQGERISW